MVRKTVSPTRVIKVLTALIPLFKTNVDAIPAVYGRMFHFQWKGSEDRQLDNSETRGGRKSIFLLL